MKSNSIIASLIVAAGLLPVDAYAAPAVYKPNNPVTATGQEINGTGPGNTNPAGTAATLIAAAQMGAKFFNAASPVAGTEATLKTKCIANSNVGNTWPEACDLKGIASALSTTFLRSNGSYQNWTVDTYAPNDQGSAIKRQIDAMVNWKSPSLVPIYGNTDHWVTVYEIRADLATSPYTLSYVKFFDAGSPGPDPNDQWSDTDWNLYEDGYKQQGASAWATTFYVLLSAPPGCDPYCNKFVLSVEPPTVNATAPSGGSVMLARYPGVLRDGEVMDESIAEERVWEALYLAQIYDDSVMWAPIERGSVGRAFPVYGETRGGETMDYYLVNILNENGDTSAMVRLSMADGAFEEMWVPTKPIHFIGVTLEEAELLAQDLLAEDERIISGVLTWNPNRSLGGSPLLPYYEFQVFSQDGELRGSVGVSLRDGRVRGLDRSLPSQQPSWR